MDKINLMKPYFLTLITLFLLLKAEAQTWVRQNPFEHLSQMHDIAFDGKYGIAVGVDATVMTTTNGGLNWVKRSTVPTATFFTAAYVVPQTDGQVMLASGDSLMVMTRDGGATWITSHNEIPYAYKFQKMPDGTLMALGSDFGLYLENQGLVWQPFNMPGPGVTAGHFINTLEGWVAMGPPDNVQIYHTSNRGFNWEILDPLKHPYVKGIEMIDEHTGYLASRDYVYKTIDGGQSWHPLNTVAAGSGIQDLFIVDHDKLWTTLDDGSIYLSTNGGVQWEEKDQDIISGNRTLAIWANAQGHVWTVGKYLSILYSPDFGLHWTDQVPAVKNLLFEPNFNNAFYGMVGGNDGALLRTSNSGASWERLAFPRDENFTGVVMLGDSTAVIASSTGSVFITHDFGDNWTLIEEDLGQVTDLFAINNQTLILANELGEIYRSEDAGHNWELVHDIPQSINSIRFYDAAFGWAVGDGGYILLTKDGGDTWETQFTNFDLEFSDVYFVNNVEGWVTSKNFTDKIWHTTNGGGDWETVTLPISSYWEGVAFSDTDLGWIVGGTVDNGVIYRTDDGGDTWVLDHTSPDPFRGIYAIPNGETAWAVGFGGNIMKYSECTSPPLLTELRGNLEPCFGDTIQYVTEFDDVDLFHWTFPDDWYILGNSNSNIVQFIAGSSIGEVTVRGTDVCGDSTDILIAHVVPVTPPDVVISEESGVLSSNVTSGVFQWLLNGTPINGANSPTYIPLVNGTYQLHFTTFTSGCETYSNTVTFNIISTTWVDDDKLHIHPNPAGDFIIIGLEDGSHIPAGAEFTLTTLDGREVMRTALNNRQINIQDVSPGIYAVRVRTENEILMRKIVVE